MVADANAEQPEPVKASGPAIWDLVILDMRERNRIGTTKYGTALKAFNGRDALIDAYQEALDLAVYLRQAIARNGRMAGSVNPPNFCICGAKLWAIQEGRAFYKCGSRGTEWRKKLRLLRTPACFEAVREKTSVQNPDGEK